MIHRSELGGLTKDIPIKISGIRTGLKMNNKAANFKIKNG